MGANSGPGIRHIAFALRTSMPLLPARNPAVLSWWANGRGFHRPALIETMPAMIITRAPIFPGVIGSLKNRRDHTMAQT
jgi:hypothetical protein